MVRLSMIKHMITTIQNVIDDDLVLPAVNKAMEDNYYSDEEINEEEINEGLNDVVSTLNQIEEKVCALLSIHLYCYLNPRVPIEKAPHISEFLLHRLEDKQFKKSFECAENHF